jgi:carbon monoxide dehydrogenase subunit G
MKSIALHKLWVVRAPKEEVFRMITDFENFPKYFPKVAETIEIKKREGDYLEIVASVRSFGSKFPVQMKTQILPERGFISDNVSGKFGTSGHEELLLSESDGGTLVDYTYQVSIHKPWLRLFATPLIRWYSMKYWEKAVINELKKRLEN